MTRTPIASAKESLESVERRFPGAVELAELTSTAVVIEPELLRSVRLVLAKQIGADAEGDLWVSEIVDTREVRAITLVPDIAELLRNRLRVRLLADSSLRRQLAELLGNLHGDLPVSLRLEERIRWITVTEPENRIEPETEPLLAAALEGVLDSSRVGLARWAARALRRLPLSTMETPSAARLAQVLVNRGSLPPTSLPEGFGSSETLGLADVSDLVDWLGTTALGIRRTGDVLELGNVGVGGEAIAVQSTEPRLVEVDGVTQRVAAGELKSCVVGWGPINVRNAAGDVYTLNLEPHARRISDPLCVRVDWPGGTITVGVAVDDELVVTVGPAQPPPGAARRSPDLRVQIPNTGAEPRSKTINADGDTDNENDNSSTFAASILQTGGSLAFLRVPGLRRSSLTPLTRESPAGGLWVGRGFTSNGELRPIAGRFPETDGTERRSVRVSAQVETVAGSPVCRGGLVAGVIERVFEKTEGGQQVAIISSARIRELIDSHYRVDLGTGRVMTGHTGRVVSVACTLLDGRPVAVTGGRDRTVRVWDLTTCQPWCKPLTGHADVVASVACALLDGRPVAVTSSRDGTVRVWDLTDGKPLGDPLTGHDGAVVSVACTLVDRRPVAVTAGWDGTVRAWDLNTGEPLGDPMIGHEGAVTSVACTLLDGRPVAVSGGRDKTVRVWDVTASQSLGEHLTGHTATVEAVACTLVDGRPVAVSGGGDRTVRVWDLITGQQLGEPLTGPDGAVTSVACTLLDGRPVAVTADKAVRVWELITGRTSPNP